MNKKWVASTALASVLAAVGISSNTSHVRASVSADDKSNDNDSATTGSNGKDTSVASVMDEQGAPVSDSTDTPSEGSDISDAKAAKSSLLKSQTSALTQATTTAGATSSQQQAFLSMAVPMAQKAAATYGVYTSVMLAQSILESGWGTSTLATEGNNLFGIKGDYNGAYVTMKTAEWSAEQGWYYIYANFCKYPSYLESFADNGNKLRNGVSWDSKYYSGAWKENAATYKDATAALQGKYATAPTYASTLNNMIETYNLTKYDGESETDAGSDGDNNGGATQQVNGTQTKIDDIATVTKKGAAALYTDAYPDQQVSTRALGEGTPWRVISKVVTPEGETYYQVSTHEFVKASDVQLKSEEGSTTQPPVSISDTATISNTNGAVVYSSGNANATTDRTLPYKSSWVTTAYVLGDDGAKYYLVGTGSYVKDSDIQLASETTTDESDQDVIVDYPDVVHVIASPSARLYNSKHQVSTNRALAANTDWKVDKKSTHSDGSIWYRVSSDEWVSANDVQVTGSNYVTSVNGTVKINYIPGYGINVYNSPAATHKFTGTRLADGTTWKVNSKQIVDGTTWYQVQGGWIDGKYCIYTAI
ncbi:glycoside hydrolase family 73 protein [Companilactobacillus keshanensis]|uniref:Glycoside hydrolase family 73 protein n=1 Tax=Companilactobacillus keshanensis TaxID=2486003 RepID=A0ABW4BUB9_9LACO|nr:glycoside hydrolase family 73 protein [Companilactobacillus keshanensis]